MYNGFHRTVTQDTLRGAETPAPPGPVRDRVRLRRDPHHVLTGTAQARRRS